MKINFPAKTNSGVRLVYACAWCPKEENTPLQNGEEYTHGICEPHKQQMLQNRPQLQLRLIPAFAHR
jgi:hypothetical protein